MKPVLLSMQAFGPFAQRETIDFAKLGEHPLFLINGPTGAGKTTLLDAISYALFGKTTGAERQGEQMRCHHAAASTATEVDFIFSLGNDLYRVKRLPAQQRPKLRGAGLKDDVANASLWHIKPGIAARLDLDQDDMTLLASRKVKQVTQEVERLIGLQADQFRQVVVLPQGKFRELLTADAGQREEIFAQLFQTHRYLLIEEKLKDAARDLKQQVQEHESNLKALLRNGNIESEQQLTDKISEQAAALDIALNNKDSAAEQLQKQRELFQHAVQLQQLFEQKAQLQQQLSQLNKDAEQINEKQTQLKRARAAQAVTPSAQRFDWLKAEQARIAQQLQANEKKHAALVTDKQHAEKQYQQAATEDAEGKQLQRRIEQLSSWRPKLESLKALQRQYAEVTELRNEQQGEVNQRYRAKETLNEQLTTDSQARQALSETLSKHQNIESQRQQLSYAKKQQQNSVNLKQQQQQLNDQQQAIKEQLDTQQQQTKKSEQHAQALEHTWYQQQAISLAETLKPRQPCPVCGSRQHPSPASSGDEPLVTHEQVVNARQQHQQQLQAQQKLERSLLQNRQASEFVQIQIEELGNVKTEAELTSAQQALELTAEQQEQQRAHYQTLEHRITENREQLDSIALELKQLTDKLKETDINQTKIGERLSSLEQEIPEEFRSPEQVERTLKELHNELLQKQTAYQKASERRQQVLEQLSAVTAKHDDLTQQQHENSEQTLAAEKELSQQLDEREFKSLDEYKDAIMPDQRYQQTEQEIQLFQQQRAKISSLLEELDATLGKQQQPDLDTAKQQLQHHEQQYQQTNEVWLNTRDRLRELETLLNHVNNSKKQAEALHKQYAVQGTLADVANGQNAQRLSLHRFVLSVLLDDVLTVASQRLEKMTHGRYQLSRESQVADARSAGGLTILVEDAYTGQQRSTKTLSGGEGFMAALALALGLSDVVQSYAGGIKLDTLFVDEGFGSLDEEALDMAIDTLAELRASGRTIGIISHVRELKDRLHDRIDVIRERNGSRIELRTN